MSFKLYRLTPVSVTNGRTMSVHTCGKIIYKSALIWWLYNRQSFITVGSFLKIFNSYTTVTIFIQSLSNLWKDYTVCLCGGLLHKSNGLVAVTIFFQSAQVDPSFSNQWKGYIQDGQQLLHAQQVDFSRPHPTTDKLYMNIGGSDVIEVGHPPVPDEVSC